MMDIPLHWGAYPDLVTLERAWDELAARGGERMSVVGHSVEGRPLRAFELGREGAPTVLLTALIHGVEVIGSLALYGFVQSLVEERDPLLDDARLVVMPIVNPDAVARNSARLAAGKIAFMRGNARGVDLNRNFPRVTARAPTHPFAGSRFRSSPHYAGPHALSEPESCAVAEVARKARPAVAVGFHSFGGLLLYPWAHTRLPNPRRARYERVGKRFRGALPTYDVMQAMQFYPTIGDLDDWLDAELGTMAFTVEVSRPRLRPLVATRRVLDPFCWMNPSDARNAVAEVVPALRAMSDEALDAAA
jgi:hypothetical protein